MLLSGQENVLTCIIMRKAESRKSKSRKEEDKRSDTIFFPPHKMGCKQNQIGRENRPRHPIYLGGNHMPEMVVPGPVNEERSIREAVCIHTRKIFDSCKEEDIALLIPEGKREKGLREHGGGR